MSMIKLRPYQLQAILKAEEAIRKGNRRPAVVLPTGAGKTVVFSHMAERWVTRIGAGTGPVLILVHRWELIRQTVEKLATVCPDLKVGVIQGNRHEVEGRDVLVASVPSLAKETRLEATPRPGLIIVDECHHAAASSYRMILDYWPVPAVGFTATMSRQDGKALADIWEEVVYQRDILDMINDRWLCDVKGQLVRVNGLTLADVSMSGGDYSATSLSDALRTAEAQRFVLDAVREHAHTMPGIVFTPSVESALAFAEAFVEAGYRAAPVWGAMDPDLRRSVLKEYDAGQIQWLVNCMVLTEGFDSPRAQCAVIARPTTSPALYTQMVGRVLRPYPGKKDALVLDVVGVSQEHALATLADLTSRRLQDILPGESLLEAVVRERDRRNPNLSGYVVTTQEVDLFHRSRTTWLETYGGIWFIPIPDALVFIWPDTEPGQYRVGLRPLRRPGGRFHAEGLDLEMALAFGEGLAEEYVRQLSERDGEGARIWDLQRAASWKRRGHTGKQSSFAERLGLTVEPSATRGQVSDMINVELASQVLDRVSRP